MTDRTTAPADRAPPAGRDRLAFADQPARNRLRRAVAGAFTAGTVERLRPRAQELLDDPVGGVVLDGPPADLVERALGPFPTAVVSEVTGVPAADRERVDAWTRRTVSTSGGSGGPGRARITGARSSVTRPSRFPGHSRPTSRGHPAGR
ncbi:hypothetical protein SUDANB6_00532 [Streptomyces sp. enrichment culture]